MLRSLALAGLVLLVTACSSEVGGESGNPHMVFYVAVDGEDTNAGLQPDDAFGSLAFAVSAAASGDEIRILPGTYSEGLVIEGFGDVDATTTIMGYDGVPVFDGGGEASVGIFCEACTNVVISCLEITGYTDIGIGATRSSEFVLRDLVVHHNGSAPTGLGWGAEGYGIHVDDSSDVVVEYTDVHDNGPNPVVAGGPMLGTGINTFNLQDAVIRDNTSYQNHGGGILVEDSTSIVVENNRVFDNDLDATAAGWWDAGLWIDGGHDIVVRGNTFSGNLGPGIQISDEDGQDPTGYVLEGNVASGNYFGIYIWGFGGDTWPDAILRSDNLFHANSRTDIWIEPGE